LGHTGPVTGTLYIFYTYKWSYIYFVKLYYLAAEAESKEHNLEIKAKECEYRFCVFVVKTV
jgi:hypothetical protein